MGKRKKKNHSHAFLCATLNGRISVCRYPFDGGSLFLKECNKGTKNISRTQRVGAQCRPVEGNSQHAQQQQKEAPQRSSVSLCLQESISQRGGEICNCLGAFFVVVFVMNQDVEHEKEQLKINKIVIVKVLVKLKKISNALNNWACGLIS